MSILWETEKWLPLLKRNAPVALFFLAFGVVVGYWIAQNLVLESKNATIERLDGKIEDLQAQADAQRDSAKTSETLRRESANLREQLDAANSRLAAAKVNSDALTNVLSAQLRQAQEKYEQLKKAHSSLKQSQRQDEISTSKEKKSLLRSNDSLNLEQIVQAIADQQNSAFLVIDNYVMDLQSFSYGMYVKEGAGKLAKITPSYIANITNFSNFLTDLMGYMRDYYELQVRLEQLHVKSTKNIVEHFNNVLSKLNAGVRADFLSEVREKPVQISEVATIVNYLKGNENFDGWNSAAVKVLNGYISSGALPKSPASTSPSK